MLDGLVDESDPDVDFPNSFHAFQTAEGIRKAHPDKGAPPSRGGLPWEGRWVSAVSWPHPCAPSLLLLPLCPNLTIPTSLLCPSPSQTGSTSWGCCTTWGRSWFWQGSPR